MEKEKQESILVSYIKDRVQKKNKNFLMLFVGATGSGKSFSALALAEELDPTFDISRVCFKAKDFMMVINSLVERAERGEEIKGKVVMWDEFGVEHNAREFMTISNRVINYFFQTSRHLNLIVIMTVPLLSFIDSSTRKLSHGIAEMQGINSKDKTATVKVKMLQTNVMTGKEYPKYLRYRRKNRLLVSKRIKFNLPTGKLIEEYEVKKKRFTTQLNIEIMNKLIKSEEKDKPLTNNSNVIVSPTGAIRPLTPFQEKIWKCYNEGITSQTEIGKMLGKSPQQVSENVKFMRRKGYYIQNKVYPLENMAFKPREPSQEAHLT